MRHAIIGYGLAIAATIGAKVTYDAGQREQGALRERLRAADSTAKELGARVVRSDTAYTPDTLRWVGRVRGLETSRRRLLATLDSARRAPARAETTFVAGDTVVSSAPAVAPALEVDLRAFVAASDSSVQACRLVVQSCEARVAVRDSLLDVQRRRIEILTKQRPGVVRRWGGLAVAVGAGFLLGVTR